MGKVQSGKAVVSVLLVCLVCLQGEAKKCVRFEDIPPLKGCAAAGYNHTYPLPDGLSSRTTSFITNIVSHFTKSLVNCSVAQMAETIMCMSYAPKCTNADQDPVLPCRRVCSEFMRRCDDTLPEWIEDWMIQRCMVLPDTTPASGKCYEPKQFDKHFTSNTTGVLERGCQKLVNFPFCEGLGYNYTISSARGQLRSYNFFYGKNISDGDPATPAPNSILNRIIWRMRNQSKCAKSIHKLFCSEIVPPCFPNEGAAYYTVCQPICTSIGQQCPEALSGRGGIYYSNCERMAPGSSSHGFCKHTKLPPISDWFDYFKDSAPSKPPPQVSVTVIVISVVIPVVFLAVIITVVVVLWKKRKFDNLFNYQRQE